MSFIGDLLSILNIGKEVYRERYVQSASPFAVHISNPREAEYDIDNIKFIIAVEHFKDSYSDRSEEINIVEETVVPIVRNPKEGDDKLKGEVYLYTISNNKLIPFTIHNIQLIDLSVPVDCARERWFHNEEREIQFLVMRDLKISRIDIDYDSGTDIFRPDPDHNHKRMVCAEHKDTVTKVTRQKV